MPTFVQILDFIGTFAFAISGIRLASAKRFDWFGAYVVGLATAIGGGTIRDVLLDVTPGWMTDPIYLICTGVALLWVICFGRWLIRLNNTFFIFDSIGLALFTVVGVGKSIALGYPFWVAIIMGSITGAAGGVPVVSAYWCACHCHCKERRCGKGGYQDCRSGRLCFGSYLLFRVWKGKQGR